MVLPFAVVETTVVAFAVHWIGNMSRGYERFVIADQRFRIEIGGLRGVAKVCGVHTGLLLEVTSGRKE